jgi:hypothetical protein
MAATGRCCAFALPVEVASRISRGCISRICTLHPTPYTYPVEVVSLASVCVCVCVCVRECGWERGKERGKEGGRGGGEGERTDWVDRRVAYAVTG